MISSFPRIKFRNFMLLLLMILFWNVSSAQKGEVSTKDTSKFYKDVKEFSKRSKFSKFVYSKIFRGPEQKKLKPSAIKRRDFNLFNGKIIRNVRIQTLDPFGYVISDSSRSPVNSIQKTGNALHKKSSSFAIRNFFLFKKDQPFDSYKVAETERLIRRAGIFRDVIISPRFYSSSPDSVDLFVRVIDRWSISGKVSANPISSRITLTDHNFAGLGHDFTNSFGFRNKKFGMDEWSAIYSINRIGNTFMNISLINVDENDGTAQREIVINRPFYSPLANWAGGLTLGEITINDNWYFPDTILPVKGIRSTITDGYVSHAFHLNKVSYDFTKEQVTYENLIFSARSITQRLNSAGEYDDSLGLYKSRDYLLGMAAISLVGYETENYIFKFGEIEDVPIGLFYGLIGGIDHRNNSHYLGFRLGAATLTPGGRYYSFLFEGGKHFDYSYRNPSEINAELTYYSPLAILGKWKFRQFIRPRITFGWEQLLNKTLTLSDEGGIQGFTSNLVYGMNRANLNLQTQAYAPWDFIGFRFGPVMYFNCGMVSDNRSQLFQSNFYSSIGFGLLIKNELLVLNSFQISISFYPYIPGSNKAFKINSFRTVDFHLRDLNIDKPEFVDYQ